MAYSPIPDTDIGRGKPLSALLLTLAMLAAFVGFAPFASAHHADVSATRACPVDGMSTVTYTARSWSMSPGSAYLFNTGNNETSGYVRVQYSTDGGSNWTGLPDGAFTIGNGRQFTGTVSVPAASDVNVRVQDVGHWSNGVGASGVWYYTGIVPKPKCPDESTLPTTPQVSLTGECEAWSTVTKPENTNKVHYTSNEVDHVVTVTATAQQGYIFPESVPDELASYGWQATDRHHWKIEIVLVQNGPCTYDVIPQKHWDFGDISEEAWPSDGSATITITVVDGEATYSKSWKFDSHGNIVGDNTPLALPEGVWVEDEDVTETIENPGGWTCSREYPPALYAQAEGISVWNLCTRKPTDTIPPPPVTVPPTSSTTSTTEDVGGIVATTSTTLEVLDTVVTPTTVARPTLPRTGTNSTTMLSLAGVLLTAGAGFVLFGRRRFNGNE